MRLTEEEFFKQLGRISAHCAKFVHAHRVFPRLIAISHQIGKDKRWVSLGLRVMHRQNEDRHSGCSMIQWMSLLWRCGTLVLSEFSCRIKRRIESRQGHRYRP